MKLLHRYNMQRRYLGITKAALKQPINVLIVPIINAKLRNVGEIFLATVGGVKDVKLITGKMGIDEVERESRVQERGKGKGLGRLHVRDFPVLQRFVRSEPRELAASDVSVSHLLVSCYRPMFFFLSSPQYINFAKNIHDIRIIIVTILIMRGQFFF